MARTIPALILAASATVAAGCRLLDRIMGDAPAGPSVSKTEAPAQPASPALMLDGTIPSGAIWTHAGGDKASQVEAEIARQLQFAVGQLDGLGCIADLTRLEIAPEIPGGEPPAQGWRVQYSAKFKVAWPSTKLPPTTLTLTLPRGGDQEARRAFHAAFAPTCSDDPAAGGGYTVFWYHYRPEKKGCPAGADDLDRALATRAALALRAPTAAIYAPVPAAGTAGSGAPGMVGAVH
jgi:hypothetical protein